MCAPQLNILLPPLHTITVLAARHLRQLPSDVMILCMELMYDLCTYLLCALPHVYTNFTRPPSWLIFLCAELGSTHLDPWLAKLTCERALPGSTLPAKNSNLFSSDSGSSLTIIFPALRGPFLSISWSQALPYQYQAYINQLCRLLSDTERRRRRTTKSIPGRSPFPRPACSTSL